MSDISAGDQRKPLAVKLGCGIVVAATAVAGISLLTVAFAPIEMFKSSVESRISKKMGAVVHIDALVRTDHFSLHPVVEIRGLTIAQPAWAGAGNMVQLDRARVKFPILPLLRGQFAPESIALVGLDAKLIRTADKRENWSREKRPPESRGNGASVSAFSITQSHISMRDDRRKLTLSGTFSVTPDKGLILSTQGTFHGKPATLTATGGRIEGVDPGSPYPFKAHLVSSPLSMTATGAMKGALNLDVFDARIVAQGQDIAFLDDIIEAGLPGTQPFALSAQVHRERPDWVINRLAGQIGRSRLTGAATIQKREGRSRINGRIHAATFDFGDLSTNEGKRLALEKKARLGERVLPDTRIDLRHFQKTDGKLSFLADQLLIPGGSVFQSMSGTLRINHRVLTVDDFVARMTAGRLAGSVRVDHRSGLPKLTTNLRIEGTRLEQLMGSSKDASGPVHGRIQLNGQGETIREALSRANGSVKIVVIDGRLRALIANVIGQDLGRTIGQALGHKDALVPVRCLVAAFHAQNGQLTPNPLTMDATISVARGSGVINLQDERINLTLSGAAKKPSPLRLDEPVRISGTLLRPSVTVAGMAPGSHIGFSKVFKLVTHSIGNIFKRDTAPTAQPVNCAALAGR